MNYSDFFLVASVIFIFILLLPNYIKHLLNKEVEKTLLYKLYVSCMGFAAIYLIFNFTWFNTFVVCFLLFWIVLIYGNNLKKPIFKLYALALNIGWVSALIFILAFNNIIKIYPEIFGLFFLIPTLIYGILWDIRSILQRNFLEDFICFATFALISFCLAVFNLYYLLIISAIYLSYSIYAFFRFKEPFTAYLVFIMSIIVGGLSLYINSAGLTSYFLVFNSIIFFFTLAYHLSHSPKFAFLQKNIIDKNYRAILFPFSTLSSYISYFIIILLFVCLFPPIKIVVDPYYTIAYIIVFLNLFTLKDRSS